MLMRTVKSESHVNVDSSCVVRDIFSSQESSDPNEGGDSQEVSDILVAYLDAKN